MLVALKKRLLDRGLSQTALAKVVNINRFRLSRIVRERVRPRTPERRRIAQFLDAREGDLFPFVRARRRRRQ